MVTAAVETIEGAGGGGAPSTVPSTGDVPHTPPTDSCTVAEEASAAVTTEGVDGDTPSMVTITGGVSNPPTPVVAGVDVETSAAVAASVGGVGAGGVVEEMPAEVNTAAGWGMPSSAPGTGSVPPTTTSTAAKGVIESSVAEQMSTAAQGVGGDTPSPVPDPGDDPPVRGTVAEGASAMGVEGDVPSTVSSTGGVSPTPAVKGVKAAKVSTAVLVAGGGAEATEAAAANGVQRDVGPNASATAAPANEEEM